MNVLHFITMIFCLACLRKCISHQLSFSQLALVELIFLTCFVLVQCRLLHLSMCFILKEPGTEAQIKQFAQSYNAQFDMFSKIDVNGDNAHPLWKWLKEQPNGSGFLGK